MALEKKIALGIFYNQKGNEYDQKMSRFINLIPSRYVISSIFKVLIEMQLDVH